MNEHEPLHDPEDRLVDRALSETLGGESPPDLSERILAAAKQQPLATPVTDNSAWKEARPTSKSERKYWALFATAASLFVAVGLLITMRDYDKDRLARVAPAQTSVPVPASGTPISPATPSEESTLGLAGLLDDKTSSPQAGKELVMMVEPKVIVADEVVESESSALFSMGEDYLSDGSKLERFAEASPRSRMPDPKPGVDLVNSSGRVPLVGGYGGTIDSLGRSRGQGLRFDAIGQEAPTQSANTNTLPNDVRAIQRQMKGKKEELLDIEVMKTLAVQQANSPTALEAAIQEEMNNDPMFQSFQQEQFAVTQQMTQLNEVSRRNNAPEAKRLKEHLKSLDRQIQEYRLANEKELREQFKSAPDDTLAQVMSEYMIRRRNAESDLARLEQQYKERIEQLEDQGRGPGNSGDQYMRIYENPFIEARGENAVSTFSIDVDTASYANVRQFLMQARQLPPPDAVRLEELVNYFDYDYSGPTGEVPFAAHVEVAGCPWQPEHRLVRVGIKGREIERTKRPRSNLVFLIDVSGSMNQPAKLPLLVEGMKLLTRELGENDRVAIVVYASSEGLALPSTPGDQQATILATLEQLRAGGSTAGGAGIELAYQTAQDNFIAGGTNRVILCTDGDFNVGVTSTADLERMAELKAKESGVFLTVLGFGRGNLNDAMMEAISGKGNGNYHYVDNRTEARKVLVEEMAGTLVTIAKDVKIQVEFNPAQVAGYRLLGYENRMLRTEDFNDDKKDAGEIGAGHTVTALYEIVPAGTPVEAPGVDPLKYQQAASPASDVVESDELLTLKIRYKQPDGDTSTKLEFPITDNGGSFAEATADFQFASAVASFGMLLRDSEHRGNTSYAAVLEIAENGAKRDPHGYRAEFLQLVRRAQQLAGE